MKADLNEQIELVEGVEVSVDGSVLKVKGEKGELVKKYPFPRINISKQDNKITLKSSKATKREKKQMYTVKALINNQIKGVTQGHVYKLKICSGHFPMNVSMKEDVFEIKNFIGEKVPRTLKIRQGVAVKIDGEIIEVTGIDKQIVSQTAADIEMLTRRPKFDRRIFQDGVYIIEKDGKRIR